MSSFKRTAALWILRQAARRLAEETAKRRQSGAGAGSTYRPAEPEGTYGPSDARTDRGGSRPGWAHAAGPRLHGVQGRMEDVVRRAWPYLDTPANRDRVSRFVQRMRTVANSPR